MKEENIIWIGAGLFALYLFSKSSKNQAITTVKTTPVVANPGLVQTPGLLSQTTTSQLISQTPSVLNTLQNLFGNNSQPAQSPGSQAAAQNNNASAALTASSDASYDDTTIISPSSLSDFNIPSQDISSTITGIDETEMF